uniref:USP domain-containing protein n=1 Tax=Brassica oleracea TaxID=3712 RepID=A0A3P6DPS1_BRAOL|nr:unnamed protein product [Brassica oleracea]
MHQDAHEFLNYLLNELDDILEKEAKTDNETSSSPGKISNGPKLLQANGVHKEPTVTWVHKIFQVTSSSFWLHYYTRVKLNRVPKPNQIINHIPSSHQTKSNHLKKKISGCISQIWHLLLKTPFKNQMLIHLINILIEPLRILPFVIKKKQENKEKCLIIFYF